MSAQGQPPGRQDELDLFLQQWQAELRQRPSRRLALTSGTLGADSTEHESRDISAPVVAIWTLHDDVLCEIFYAVASLEPAESLDLMYDTIRDRYTGRAGYGLGWMRLSHVCQRWRDILLGSGMAHLWGKVLFTFPCNSAFPTLLSRSRNALVDMFLHTSRYMPFTGLPPRVRAAKDNFPRTRSLRIRGGVTRDLLAVFASPLSLLNLRELDIKLEHGGDAALLHAAMMVNPQEGQVLPHIAAAGGGPLAGDINIEGPNVESASVGLTWLSLGSVHLGLHFLLPKLRHLEVHIRDLAPDLHWLISLIRTSPFLETLTLDLVLNGYVPNWNDLFAGTPAYLPHLKQLRLEQCSSIDYAPFMALICINPPAAMSATSSGTVQSTELLGDVVPPQTLHFIHNFGGLLCRSGHLALRIAVSLSPKRASRPCIVEVRSMPVFDDSDVLDTPYYSPHIDPSEDARRALNRLTDIVRISFEVPHTPAAGHAWLDTLSTHIGHKEHIEQLDLRIPQGLPEGWMETWRQNLLLPMTAVRSLCVPAPLRSDAFANSWNDIVDLLRPPLFPALHTVLIAFCAEARLFGWDVHQQLEAWWNPIIEVLVDRHVRGAAINTLRIVGGWSSDLKEFAQDLDARMIARLAGVVDNVVDDRELVSRRARMRVQLGRRG